MCRGDHPRFRHVLLTRFGVRLSHSTEPDAQWIEERTKLFVRYTIPSVNAQACRRFEWLIFCDVAYMDRIRRAIGDAIHVAHTLVPVSGVFDGAVARASTAQLSSSDLPLVTTRLDSDDAIGERFIQHIHESLNPAVREVLNLTHGIQLSGVRVNRRSDPSNAFVTLVEPRGASFGTVFDSRHDEWPKRADVRQVVTAPAWLQVIHDNNLANTAHGIAAGPSVLQEQFPALDVHVEPPPRSAVLLSAIALAVRVLRSRSRVLWAARVAFAMARDRLFPESRSSGATR